MKFISTIIALLFSSILLSQDVNMQNGTVSQCDGNFYDSGGEFGNYANDENFVLTICPENTGQKIQLNFTAFVTQLGVEPDIMTIFDGDSVAAPPFGDFSGNNSPGFIEASDTNTTGCITIQFVSNGSGNISGWEAEISCLTPCQDITAQLDSSTPTANANGEILICAGGEVDFEGSGIFSVNGTGATYEWDFGNSTTATGQSVTATYAEPGIYVVSLLITDTNPLGCTNLNSISQVVRVSPEIDFTGTEASESTICFGETTTITGVASIPQFEDCAPEIFDQTWLEDTPSTGLATSYTSTITVDCYGPGQLLTDVTQITDFCAVMEHSFMGDLTIILEAPNGSQVLFLEYQDGTDPGDNLGIPDQADNGNPGTGLQYCFSPTATQTLDDASVGTNDIPAGTYAALPSSSFDNLLGTPLNGDWTFIIIDSWAADDGTLFSWNLNFDASLVPPSNTIVSEAWDTDSTITNTTGNVITVEPPNSGEFCYTYRAVDDFGCEYTEEVCIDVLPELITELPNNLIICDPGAPPYNFNLELNTNVVTASATNASDLVVTYHNSQADAENDIDAIVGSNNYSGTDGETIYVRIEYLTSGCNEVFPFTLGLSGQPVTNAVPDLVLCDDPSNDGFEEFDLSLQTLGVLGTQAATDFNVTYHLSFADADAGTGVLPNLYTNGIINLEPIYVRVESVGDSNCYNATANPLFNLVVNPRDDASFTITPTCDGAIVNITGTLGGAFTFNPAPTDGAVINPNTGEVTGGTSGATYTIEYTTNGVCPSVNAQTFNVIDIDDPSFTFTATCDGGTATITGDTGGLFSFNPLPTDAAVIDPNTGEVTNATPGNTYTIEYVTSGTCPASSTQNLTILTLDDPGFILTATCDGGTATVTGTPGGGFAFNPDLGDGAVIDPATGTITGGIPGTTYTVEYTTSGACPQSSTQGVTVLDADNASFTVAPTCDGGTATVTGTSGGTF
ncbi:PKD domain-containing protein, partial [Winogradskyella sp.]|uniref:PKD domain-containing protein n=1 Tax=Winogradskyella sp. TaxID=1883156 RepID=UPI0026392AD3